MKQVQWNRALFFHFACCSSFSPASLQICSERLWRRTAKNLKRSALSKKVIFPSKFILALGWLSLSHLKRGRASFFFFFLFDFFFDFYFFFFLRSTRQGKIKTHEDEVKVIYLTLILFLTQNSFPCAVRTFLTIVDFFKARCPSGDMVRWSQALRQCIGSCHKHRKKATEKQTGCSVALQIWLVLSPKDVCKNKSKNKRGKASEWIIRKEKWN